MIRPRIENASVTSFGGGKLPALMLPNCISEQLFEDVLRR
jgi:hypothetical protein